MSFVIKAATRLLAAKADIAMARDYLLSVTGLTVSPTPSVHTNGDIQFNTKAGQNIKAAIKKATEAFGKPQILSGTTMVGSGKKAVSTKVSRYYFKVDKDKRVVISVYEGKGAAVGLNDLKQSRAFERALKKVGPKRAPGGGRTWSKEDYAEWIRLHKLNQK